MNKIIIALLVMSGLLFSSNTFSQNTNSVKIPEYSGCGEAGCRFVGNLESSDKNWTKLEGKILKGKYTGYSFTFEVSFEINTTAWMGLLYKEVPVREISGTITLKKRHLSTVINGTFDVVQGYDDYTEGEGWAYSDKALLIECHLDKVMITNNK